MYGNMVAFVPKLERYLRQRRTTVVLFNPIVWKREHEHGQARKERGNHPPLTGRRFYAKPVVPLRFEALYTNRPEVPVPFSKRLCVSIMGSNAF